MTEYEIRKIEVHLKRTFGSATLNVKPRPKQKDSAEV